MLDTKFGEGLFLSLMNELVFRAPRADRTRYGILSSSTGMLLPPQIPQKSSYIFHWPATRTAR